MLWLLCPVLTAAAQSDAAAYLQDRETLDALMADGETQSAFELVQTLNARNPKDALQWWTQGRLAARLELWDMAAEAYTRSMTLGSGFEAVTARRIAEAHAQAGRRQAAFDWLARALALGLDRRFALVDNPAFSTWVDDPAFLQLAGRATDTLANRADRWRADINFLLAEAQRMHAHPERPATRAPFLDAAETLKAQAGTRTDTEMMMGLHRLVVMLGDGHSRVQMRDGQEQAQAPVDVEDRTLPVFFHPFEDDVYIIDGQDVGTELIGGRVVAFGEVPIRTFLERVDPYVHKDNAESWKFIGVQFGFRYLALHQTVGTATETGVPVTVEFREGRRATRVLPGGAYAFPRKLRPMPGQTAIPLFLEDLDGLYRAVPLPAHRAQYIQINNFRDEKSGESLAAFFTRTVDEALVAGMDHLILDLRRNNGGNNVLCAGPLRDLLRFQFAGPDHRLFVITRHETFSAAQNCSNRIEAVTDAVFVGEPSASRPNFTGEETQTMLPYSGLLVSLSNHYWQDAQPWDNRPWIEMDLPAPLTFEDYATGRDPALEAIFAVIAVPEAQPTR